MLAVVDRLVEPWSLWDDRSNLPVVEAWRVESVEAQGLPILLTFENCARHTVTDDIIAARSADVEGGVSIAAWSRTVSSAKAVHSIVPHSQHLLARVSSAEKHLTHTILLKYYEIQLI